MTGRSSDEQFIASSPSGLRMTCGVVGVHERAIFRERTQGKDLEGSLEGKASQEHDPAITRVGDPGYGEASKMTKLGYEFLTHSISVWTKGHRRASVASDEAVANTKYEFYGFIALELVELRGRTPKA